MRRQLLLVAVSLLLGASSASAGTLRGTQALFAMPDRAVSLVHHKPGHQGGPPWARRGYGRDDDRDDWREERRYRREPAYTQVCRTEYRTRFDPYEEDYVREPVRVCREGYGYE